MYVTWTSAMCDGGLLHVCDVADCIIMRQLHVCDGDRLHVYGVVDCM